MQQNILQSTTNISRNIIRSYARKIKNANPGIQKRINVLEEQNEANLDNIDVEEFESDFMNVGEMYKKHEQELNQYREKEKYWIIRQKYFKEAKINFLTWNDKEQIRHLHQSDPNEWSVEKLSQGFPAFPESIKKIIQNKWQIKNDSKKKNHDQAVEKNWKMLKEGNLSEVLPPNIINHLLKFSTRKQNILQESNVTKNIIISQKPEKNKEFSSIISSYKKIKEESQTNEEINQNSNNGVTRMIEDNLKSFGNKVVTLDMLKENVTEKLDKDSVENSEDIFVPKFRLEKSEIVPHNTNKNNTNIVSYPEKIKIPKDKYKKGSTYKLNDCYYDDDGEFLYRVPGMY